MSFSGIGMESLNVVQQSLWTWAANFIYMTASVTSVPSLMFLAPRLSFPIIQTWPLRTPLLSTLLHFLHPGHVITDWLHLCLIVFPLHAFHIRICVSPCLCKALFIYSFTAKLLFVFAYLVTQLDVALFNSACWIITDLPICCNFDPFSAWLLSWIVFGYCPRAFTSAFCHILWQNPICTWM